MISQIDSFPLSAAELDSFNKNGFIGPFKVYDPEEMQERWRRIRLQLLDRSRAAYDVDALSGVTNIANYDRHLDNELLAEHICRNEIVDRVQSILGPNVLCWRSEFFPKYPGDEGTDWHQADTFANACGKPQIVWPQNNKFGGTITAWTAFTTASKKTGCLQFVPGTHESMNYDETKQMHYDPSRINQTLKDGVQRGFFGYDYRQLQIDPEWQPDESLASSFEMKAGEVILFWSTLMHASHPHLGETEDPRIGFATRYVPSSVRIYPDTEEIEEYGGRVSLEKFGAVVVRGVHEDNGNKIAKRTLNDTPFLTGINND